MKEIVSIQPIKPSTPLSRKTHIGVVVRLIGVCTVTGILSACSALKTQTWQVPHTDIQDVLPSPKQWINQVDANSTALESANKVDAVSIDLLQLFNDEYLSRLVEDALENNIDLKIVAAQVDEANYNARASHANNKPTLQGSLGAGRGNNSGFGTTSNSFQLSLDAAWEVDLWGKLKQERYAQETAFQAQVEDYQRARDSIAAQTMQSWFNVITSLRILDNQKERLESFKLTEEIVKERYLSGLGTLNDLDAAQRNAAQTRASLTQAKESTLAAKRGLQVLLGQYPSAIIDSALSTPYQLPQLDNTPAPGIPAELLTRRPDLKAAWQRTLSAGARYDVSQRELYPSFSLTASGGERSSELENLFDNPSIWNLASNLTAPLFNAGALKNRAQASLSRAEQAYLQYLNVALNAFLEVENALSQEQSLAEQERALSDALDFAQRTYENAQADYNNGVINILNLLNTQIAVFDVKSQLINIRNQRLNNRVTLGLALGKGM